MFKNHFIKISLICLALIGCLAIILVVLCAKLKVNWLESPSSQPLAENIIIDDVGIKQLFPYLDDISSVVKDYLITKDLSKPTKLAINTNIPTSIKANNVISLYTPHLTKQLEARGFNFGSSIVIRIFKVPSILEVWVKKNDRYVLFKTYDICRFSGQLGPKTKNGDRQAPEGFYIVYPKQLNPNSSYFLSFDLGYPNAYDRYYNRTGNALMVHGECVSIGCYAMTNSRIAEIYTLMYGAFAAGQSSIQVQVYPFALTDNNMRKMKNHKWYSFWTNLKVGYDAFERTRQISPISVVNGRYQFTP